MFTRPTRIKGRRRTFAGVVAAGIGFVLAVSASGGAHAADAEPAAVAVTARVVGIDIDAGSGPSTGGDLGPVRPPVTPVQPIEPITPVLPIVPPVVTPVLQDGGVVVAELDRNRDGRIDWWGIDMDGDGDIDIVAIDDDFDGKADRFVFIPSLG